MPPLSRANIWAQVYLRRRLGPVDAVFLELTMKRPVPRPEAVASLIFVVRDKRVMLSRQLAELYCVSVSALNQAVKRNCERISGDFMFQLSNAEFEALKSHFVTSKRGLAHWVHPVTVHAKVFNADVLCAAAPRQGVW